MIILVNCLWNDYSAWTECNKDCGGGTKHRTRTVYQEAKFGGEPCEGDAKEEVACNENPCAGTAFLLHISIATTLLEKCPTDVMN